MEFLSLIPATALGYLTSRIVSHPTSRVRKKLPNIKTKRVQVFPSIRLNVFNRVIHLHHWVNYSIVLFLSFFISNGILDLMVTKGILFGMIIHGLALPKEHRKIIYRDFSVERLTTIEGNK